MIAQRAIVWCRLKRLLKQSEGRIHPSASVYISMWDPFESVGHLSGFNSRNQGRNVYKIARVMYESTQIPSEWIEPLKSYVC